jgi:hypothetical protein
MSLVEQPITLSPSHHRALRHAVIRLETQDFAGWLGDYAGQPITRALRLMPKFASDRIKQGCRTRYLSVSQHCHRLD